VVLAEDAAQRGRAVPMQDFSAVLGVKLGGLRADECGAAGCQPGVMAEISDARQ
jgi:hypothetical protein